MLNCSVTIRHIGVQVQDEEKNKNGLQFCTYNLIFDGIKINFVGNGIVANEVA